MNKKAEEVPNKGGRPKGARNKSSMIKSQLQVDDFAEEAVQILMALARNDKDFLKISSDVPCTVIQGSAKILLDKSVANEKDKLGTPVKGAAVAEKVKPRVFASAK